MGDFAPGRGGGGPHKAGEGKVRTYHALTTGLIPQIGNGIGIGRNSWTRYLSRFSRFSRSKTHLAPYLSSLYRLTLILKMEEVGMRLGGILELPCGISGISVKREPLLPTLRDKRDKVLRRQTPLQPFLTSRGRSPPRAGVSPAQEEANERRKELLDMEPKETEWRRSRHEKGRKRVERRIAI